MLALYICRRLFWQKMKSVRCELWYTRGSQESAAWGHTDVICVAALWWRDHPERDVILLSRWPFPTDRPRETRRQKDTRSVGLKVTLTFVHCSVSKGWHVIIHINNSGTVWLAAVSLFTIRSSCYLQSCTCGSASTLRPHSQPSTGALISTESMFHSIYSNCCKWTWRGLHGHASSSVTLYLRTALRQG